LGNIERSKLEHFLFASTFLQKAVL